MVNWLKNIFSYFLSQLVFNFAKEKVKDNLKRKTLIIYLKLLQALRKSLALSLIVFFILQTMVLAFIGLIITSVWLLPIDDLTTKLYILAGLFGFLFFIPLGLLICILSEKFWFKISGAEKLLADLEK